MFDLHFIFPPYLNMVNAGSFSASAIRGLEGESEESGNFFCFFGWRNCHSELLFFCFENCFLFLNRSGLLNKKTKAEAVR